MVLEKEIGKIKFSLFSPDMIRKMSATKITVPDTYNEDGYPIDGGLMDQRLGVIDPGLRCKNCGGRIRSCPGHFGHIELVRPVFHVEFARIVYILLHSTCAYCHRVLLNNSQIDELKEKYRILGDTEEDAADKIVDKMKKVKVCPHCLKEQPEVKFERPTTFRFDKKILLANEVREFLEKIPDEDLKMLGMDPEYIRPEWTILTVLLVPPVTMRPSITLETGERSEDDLTHKLVDVIRINQRLEANINAGAPQLIIEDLWELLQYHVTTYYNNETPNIPPARHRSGRPLKTLSQRLKGKEGRFRYNLSGKRVNFSARTVISPDPRISINEVGVPYPIAEELTIPIKVTDWNIEEVKKLVSNDRVSYVTSPDGKRRKVNEKTKPAIVEELASGFLVERFLQEGDIVLFNRQPSLHRISMMCHKVRIMNGKAFRMNLANCPPYNADFDGDEMNLHVPQTEEARAEAEELMLVEKQIISPRNGNAIIKGHEDHVSGAYFLTHKNAEFDKREAAQILALVNIFKLPKPDLGKNFSGKLLFSQILPKKLNAEFITKLCKRNDCKYYDGKTKGCSAKDKCPFDSYVKIVDGKLVSGNIEKNAMENVLIEKLFRISPEDARKFIDRVTVMSLHVITKHGFSVDYEDYKVSEKAVDSIIEVINKSKREVKVLVLKYKNKTLERLPGRSLKETMEEKVMVVLSESRSKCEKIIEDDLGMENTAILMAKIGARGSLLNVIQMGGLLGQQAVRGKRISRGYMQRPLHHFKRGDFGADARGFVTSSFTEGLDPREFFMHAMGGRESLVNTAIRTARSGYMQRRLINALQDFVVNSDLSVKDASKNIIQFVYGGDGVDPMKRKWVEE